MTDDNPCCNKCGKEKEFVDEPMVSGVRGWFCFNDDCEVDG